jgi:hypothetical protein
MRTWGLVVLVACATPDAVEAPGAAIGSSACSRIGPDGTGFMVESRFDVALEVGQAFVAELQFPTSAAPVNRSDIYNCGSHANTGTSGLDGGCERDAGQPEGSAVFHSLAIEFPDPLPPPVAVTLSARPLTAAGSTTAIGTVDTTTVTCP